MFGVGCLAGSKTTLLQSYGQFTYLGGTARASLPLAERRKIIHCILPGFRVLQLLSLSPDALDALMFLITGCQPVTRVRDVSINPQVFLDTLVQQSQFRDDSNTHPNSKALQKISQQPLSSDELIAVAEQRYGFEKFNLLRAKLPPGFKATLTLSDVLGEHQDCDSLLLEMEEAQARLQIARMSFEEQELRRRTQEVERRSAMLNPEASKSPAKGFQDPLV
jgi:hypothetical protein